MNPTLILRILPTMFPKLRITRPFSLTKRPHPVTKKPAVHKGLDLSVPIGWPILAVCKGRVVRVDREHEFNGNAVFLELDKDPRFQSDGAQYTAVYVHLDSVGVKVGQRVLRGEQLGRTGNTGRSTGPHLHFELWRDGVPFDPCTAYRAVEAENERGRTRSIAPYQADISKVFQTEEEPAAVGTSEGEEDAAS